MMGPGFANRIDGASGSAGTTVRRAVLALLAVLLVMPAYRASGQPVDGGPPPEMAVFETLIGNWKASCRFRQKPDDEWTVSEGELAFRWAMEQRFVIEEGEIDFLGNTFEWMGIHGYDTRAKKYTSAWIDNAATAIEQMDGAYDDASGTLTYSGEPQEGDEQPVPVKWRMVFARPDELRIEMVVSDAQGKEFVTMDMTCNRLRRDGLPDFEP